MYPIEFTHVWKKFKKGEKFNSLRDMIPHFLKNVAKQKNVGGLEELEFWAVKDASFHVKKGEVVGIIGPNGAGKSTILKLLSGIIIPNKGTMQINGRLSALIEVTAGFHPELTGRENVYLNGTILGMKKKEIDTKLEDIIDFSGIREFIDTPVKRYSSGMFSRLGFSVAAHVNPDVLLVDEVLAVGDIAFQAKCAEKMRELLKSGVTIALVSHNMPLIQSLCNRVVLLNRGEVLKDGHPDEVLPFYENLVFKEQEVSFMSKIKTQEEYKVKVDDKTRIKIPEINVLVNGAKAGESLNIKDNVTIEIKYEALETIQQPVFTLEIVRSDGVVCCASDSKENGCVFDQVHGKGTIKVNLGALNLAPGIYLPRVTVWDRDMIHPYVIAKKDIMKVASHGTRRHDNAVFIPEYKWNTQ